jgi:hypothetical protein
VPSARDFATGRDCLRASHHLAERLVAKVQGLPPGQYSMTAKIISMEGVQDSEPSNAHSEVRTLTHKHKCLDICIMYMHKLLSN